MPGNCENHLIIAGDTAAISQIQVHDIENVLLVPIDMVDRTQPFKLTMYFKTEVTSPASLVQITHVLNNICRGISIFNRHLDISVGAYYHIVFHDEDVAFIGYVNCEGVQRRFEYCPVDASSIAGIPQLFVERFNIRDMFLRNAARPALM